LAGWLLIGAGGLVRTQRPLQIRQGHQAQDPGAISHNQTVAMAFDKLAQGLRGWQLSWENQGGFGFIGIPHGQSGELSAPFLFQQIGPKQAWICQSLPALDQRRTQASGGHEGQHNPNVMGELKEQQQGS
jgi:hypothetical protein